MARKREHSANKATVTSLAFGSCTRQDIAALLKSSTGAADDRLIVAAGTLLASFEPGHPQVSAEVLEAPVAYLQSCKTVIAGDVLWQFAQRAPVGQVKIEAVRRAGCYAKDSTRKALLIQWAKTGFPIGGTFHNVQIDPRQARIAALTALGDVPRPDDNDVQAILEVIAETMDSTDQASTSIAAIKSLAKVAIKRTLPKMLDLMEKCGNSNTVLRLLGASSKFEAASLRPHRDRLVKLLSNASNRWIDDPEVTTSLTKLAGNISNTHLIQHFAGHCAGDNLATGRGAVVAAALAGYGTCDIELTRAYLDFARLPANSSTGSMCLGELKKCVKTGFAEETARRFVTQENAGYDQILYGVGVESLFGSVEQAVARLCAVMDGLPNDNERTRHSPRCALSLLMMTSNSVTEAYAFEPQAQVLMGRWRSTSHHYDPQQTAKVVERLAAAEPVHNALHYLAMLVCAVQHSAGAVSLMRQLLVPTDAIALLALETLLRTSIDVELPGPNSIPEDANLLLIEETALNAEMKGWLLKNLSGYVTVGGKLNRYVLDLMRRERLVFAKGIESALASCTTAEDAKFLIDSLVANGGTESLDLLSKACGFHSDDAALTNQVRAQSLRALAMVALQSGPDVNVVSDVMIGEVHERFNDSHSVRLAAYEACGQLEDFRNIQPLRERAKSDRNVQSQAAIAKALSLIRHRLMREKPPTSDASKCVTWLKFVADLGDGALLDEVAKFLSPPHANNAVRQAAVEAVGSLGNPAGVVVIKRFVDDTSPVGPVQAAARRARLAMEQRSDMGLFDSLGKFFPSDSDLLDPEVDYEKIFGPVLVRTLAKSLSATSDQWEAGHWEDFATRLNGVLEAMVRRVFEIRHTEMGMTQDQVNKALSKGEYGNMINRSEFKDKFPQLQTSCAALLNYRRDSSVAHATNADGTEKPGLTEDDAHYALETFRLGFERVFTILGGHDARRT